MTNLTDQHREQAREILRQWADEMSNVSWWISYDVLTIRNLPHELDTSDLVDRIASALSSRDAEIKEVLDRLQVLPPDIPPCWCRVKSMREGADHDGPCKATRALYAKLQPLPSENPGSTFQE